MRAHAGPVLTETPARRKAGYEMAIGPERQMSDVHLGVRKLDPHLIGAEINERRARAALRKA